MFRNKAPLRHSFVSISRVHMDLKKTHMVQCCGRHCVVLFYIGIRFMFMAKIYVYR